MAKPYEITESQLQEIETVRNKNVAHRLCVLAMRAEGKTLEEIAEKTGYHASTVSNTIFKLKSQELNSGRLYFTS